MSLNHPDLALRTQALECDVLIRRAAACRRAAPSLDPLRRRWRPFANRRLDFRDWPTPRPHLPVDLRPIRQG